MHGCRSCTGVAGLGHLMGDDQWKARQTCSGCENLYCEVRVCIEQRLTSLRTFHLATGRPKSIPISGVFAQPSSQGVCLFWLLLHLEFLVVFETCLPAFILAFTLPHLPPPKSILIKMCNERALLPGLGCVGTCPSLAPSSKRSVFKVPGVPL